MKAADAKIASERHELTCLGGRILANVIYYLLFKSAFVTCSVYVCKYCTKTHADDDVTRTLGKRAPGNTVRGNGAAITEGRGIQWLLELLNATVVDEKVVRLYWT